MPRPAIFFDRDGVINVSPGEGYVLSWDAFQFNPGIMETTKLCRDLGYALVLVTSQQGVGKGLMSQGTLDDIHASMQRELAAQGAAFHQIEACTHLSGTCTCRKPSPEMIYTAAAALDLDLSCSWLIGDHDRDIQMAMNAGVPNTIRVLSDHEPGVAATHTIASTAELPALLRVVLARAVP
ncbi:MAG: gmhB [Verrucomicrobiaceae bacterium]|nr:gmhB [Verrucomicrobiaceae bacterium]